MHDVGPAGWRAQRAQSQARDRDRDRPREEGEAEEGGEERERERRRQRQQQEEEAALVLLSGVDSSKSVTWQDTCLGIFRYHVNSPGSHPRTNVPLVVPSRVELNAVLKHNDHLSPIDPKGREWLGLGKTSPKSRTPLLEDLDCFFNDPQNAACPMQRVRSQNTVATFGT